MFIFRVLLGIMLFSGIASFSMYSDNELLQIKKFFFAVKQNNVERVKDFLKEGFDINFKYSYHNFEKVTPLMVASVYNRCRMVTFLIQEHAKLDARSKNGDTALIMAARTGRDRIVQRLLTAGANPLLKNKQHRTALMEAEGSLLRKYAPAYEQIFETMIAELRTACKKFKIKHPK